MNQLCSIKGMSAALHHSGELVKLETFSWRVTVSPLSQRATQINSVTQSLNSSDVPACQFGICHSVFHTSRKFSALQGWFIDFWLFFWRFFLLTLAERDDFSFHCVQSVCLLCLKVRAEQKHLSRLQFVLGWFYHSQAFPRKSHPPLHIYDKPMNNRVRGELKCAVRIFTVKFYCIDVGWKWWWTAAPIWLNAFIHSKI